MKKPALTKKQIAQIVKREERRRENKRLAMQRYRANLKKRDRASSRAGL